MPEHHSPIMLSQVQMKKALVYCCGIVYTVTHKTSLLSVILLVVGTNSIYHFQVCCLVLLCIFTVLLIYRTYFASADPGGYATPLRSQAQPNTWTSTVLGSPRGRELLL